jgi:hypothetical protein
MEIAPRKVIGLNDTREAMASFAGTDEPRLRRL